MQHADPWTTLGPTLAPLAQMAGAGDGTGLGVLAAVVFWVAAVVSVLAGAAVFHVDSMARATYALALSFVAVGLAVLTLQQGYVGVVIVLMMVMEMAVMAVYMVMFMGMNPALICR
jgi:hypothetical protein